MQRKQTKIVSTTKNVITIKIVNARKFVIAMIIVISTAIVKKGKTTQTQTMLEINVQSFNRHSIIGVH